MVNKQHMRLEFRKQILRVAVSDYYKQVEDPINEALRYDSVKPRKIHYIPGLVDFLPKYAQSKGASGNSLNDHDKYFIDEVNKYVSSSSGHLAHILKIKDPINRGEKLVYFLYDDLHDDYPVKTKKGQLLDTPNHNYFKS
jgi:hypothetical protein